MPESYSRTEVDLKLENLEQRIDSKLDKVLAALVALEAKVDTKFNLMNQNFEWLKWLTGATFFLVLGALLTAAIKILAH